MYHHCIDKFHPTFVCVCIFVQDPNEDTEWNEILRDFGVLPPKEEPKDEIEEMVLRLQEEAMGRSVLLAGQTKGQCA